MHSQPPKSASLFRRLFGGIGPAIIVACIVLGPGSILTSSKVGCQFGFSMAWILVAAGCLMFVAVASASRIGVSLKHTPLKELRLRLGVPVGFIAGVNVFLIASCFQFSNNLGVLAGIEALTDLSEPAKVWVLVGLNGLIISCLFGFKSLYQRIEQLMMLLMGMMLLGFAANLIMARPSIVEAVTGLIPSLPDDLPVNFLPQVDSERTTDEQTVLFDPWITIQGLIATSFSIAGAFYQAYLVREKGWSRDELNRGLFDSVVGTSVLIGVTLMIMLTSATVLHGNVLPAELKSAGDVAIQLEPLFGSAAKWLFAIGLLAGAVSSFLVNSVLGGTFMADGLGQDASLGSLWTRLYTVAVLLIGMIVALTTTHEGRVPLIIFAQAMTVLGGPILIATLIYFGSIKQSDGIGSSDRSVAQSAPKRILPGYLTAFNCVGAVVVLSLAYRTLVRIYLVNF